MKEIPSAMLIGGDEADGAGLRRELEGVVRMDGAGPGGDGGYAAVRAQAPDVVFVSTDADPTGSLSLARRIVRTVAGMPVLLVARRKDPDLILEAMRMGAADFLVYPDPDGTLADNVRRALGRGSGAVQTGEVTAVFSLKGGQGITSVAANLADQVQRLSTEPVLLFDLNLYLGDANIMLDCPAGYTPFDLVRDLPRMDRDLLFSSLTRHNREFYFLGADSQINDAERISGDDVGRCLNLLRRHLSHIILDLPHDFNERTVSAIEAADHVLLVVQQSLPVLKNVQAALSLFDELGFSSDKVKVVVNRFRSNTELGVEDIGYVLEREVFAIIRNDYDTLMAAVNGAQTLAAAEPAKGITQDLAALAGRLVGISPRAEKPEGWLARLRHAVTGNGKGNRS